MNSAQIDVATMNETVVSTDGTIISYLTFGTGPAVIVVPGALATASDFAGLAIALAKNFTVHVMERRGRGASGPQGKQYCIEREVEDLFSLQAKTKARYIFGHSFGGFLALEAARNQTAFEKIAVYEPGVAINGSINMKWIPRAQKELEQHRYHAAFTTFVQGLDPNSARLPHWLLSFILKLVIKKNDLQRKYPLLAGTIREHQEEERLANTYAHYKEISAKVMCMYSGGTGDSAKSTAMTLASVIANYQTVAFPKLNHLAPEDKPEAIALELIGFFNDEAMIDKA